MRRRIAVTGMGVVSPNGVGVQAFELALRKGSSGIRGIPSLREKGFSCTVGGVPDLSDVRLEEWIPSLLLRGLSNSAMLYGGIAGVQAWRDAGLMIAGSEPHLRAGCWFGTGMGGAEPFREAIYKVDSGDVRRLGSRAVEQCMASGVSAMLGGILGLGNRVSTNSSACSTGTEAVILAADYIRAGKADIMLAGSADGFGPYLWGGFDSLRVLNRTSNEEPESASAPMSNRARGFVPGGGAGALVLEDWDHAVKRGAIVYAEYMGGAVNSGGQRNGGTMTAPNASGVIRCIEMALEDSGVFSHEIDLINGHLTSTMGDVNEIRCWTQALNRYHTDFPIIQSVKSMIGHCLAAAGSIETVSAVIQLYKGFVAPSLNAHPLHSDIASLIDGSVVAGGQHRSMKPHLIAKSSFGFGDVNAVLLLKKIL